MRDMGSGVMWWAQDRRGRCESKWVEKGRGWDARSRPPASTVGLDALVELSACRWLQQHVDEHDRASQEMLEYAYPTGRATGRASGRPSRS